MAPLHVERVVGHVEAALKLDVVVSPVDEGVLRAGVQPPLVRLPNGGGGGGAQAEGAEASLGV